MKIILTESQVNFLILNEQGHLDTGFETDRYSTAEKAAATNKGNREMVDSFGGPHKVMELLSIGTLFVPVVGPLISLGIGLADAGLYLKEGKKKEAGIAAALSILPFSAEAVAAIPVIKQLGQKGMQALATKLASNMELGMLEKRALEDILKKKSIVYKAVKDYSQKVAVNASQRMNQLGPAQKVAVNALIGHTQNKVRAATVNGVVNALNEQDSWYRAKDAASGPQKCGLTKGDDGASGREMRQMDRELAASNRAESKANALELKKTFDMRFSRDNEPLDKATRNQVYSTFKQFNQTLLDGGSYTPEQNFAVLYKVYDWVRNVPSISYTKRLATKFNNPTINTISLDQLAGYANQMGWDNFINWYNAGGPIIK